MYNNIEFILKFPLLSKNNGIFNSLFSLYKNKGGLILKSKVLMILGNFISILVSAAIFVFTFSLIEEYTVKAFSYGKEFSKKLTDERPYEVVDIVLSRDLSLDEISELLEEKGVIPSALAFKVENMLNGSRGDFLAGTYTVNKNMDHNQLNSVLRAVPSSNNTNEVRAIIREGFTIKDIAEYLESLEVVDAQEFLEAAQNEIFDYPFFIGIPDRDNKLEGYLFPDTYFFLKNSTPRVVINKMLSRFNEIYSHEYIERTQELGLTVDEVVIKASIIEKEVRFSQERARVASVINNRLDMGMELQMCSTILYVLDKRKDRLLEEDLKVQSPYNTYIHSGLPIGPISNPSAECIRAVLYPEDTDYIFFVMKDDETGEHFFTDNYDEFLRAKALYNQKF